jgi:hypothetical protein
MSARIFDDDHATTAPPPEAEPRKPLSEQKLAANRANAQKSTGPRTDEGKKTVSQNARKHGCSQAALLPNECDATYEIFYAELKEDLRPRSPMQWELVSQISQILWKLRTADAEPPLYELNSNGDDPACHTANAFHENPTRNDFLVFPPWLPAPQPNFALSPSPLLQKDPPADDDYERPLSHQSPPEIQDYILPNPHPTKTHSQPHRPPPLLWKLKVQRWTLKVPPPPQSNPPQTPKSPISPQNRHSPNKIFTKQTHRPPTPVIPSQMTRFTFHVFTFQVFAASPFPSSPPSSSPSPSPFSN